jgi:hypothetical protein
MINKEQIITMWDGMVPQLNEKQRRLYAGTLANTYGRGGIKVIHELTGMSENTIRAGKSELKNGTSVEHAQVRREGGGPKYIEEMHPDVQELISRIIDGSTYGDPGKVLSWTTESLRKIESELFEKHKIKVSHVTISSILEDMGYSKQANQKMLQIGKAHPDRNTQFKYINSKANKFIAMGEPVISVDTKKKENIGNFKNSGEEYRPSKDPRKVLDHDFPIEELGKIAPYGIYNLNSNTGFVNVGTSRDTAEFAVESIWRWWETVGENTFPDATRLLITCDCGGSNGYRVRLWKYQLAQFAARTGIEVHVSHFPPGTSKWNKVEHRLFCFISKNWQGKPLIDIETAAELIGSTTTTKGLKVICQRDDNIYKPAVAVSDEQFDSIKITMLGKHGEWNYKIK